MYPFLVIFGCITIFSFIDTVNIKWKIKNIILFMLALMLIIFAALRYGGRDYAEYELFFYNSANWDFSKNSDIGFVILNKFLSNIWYNPLIIFLTIAILSVSLNVKCFNDYGKFAIIALLFYFVHNYLLKEMIQIRSGLSCAIGLYNIRNLSKGNYVKFWLFEFLAITLHLGAIILILGWLLKRFSITRQQWIFLLILCFLIGMIYPFGSLLKNFPYFDSLSRIQIYSYDEEQGRSLGILDNPATLKQLFLCGILLFFYNKFRDVKYFTILTSMYIASTCWLMLWNDFAIVGARLATYLSVGEPILISGILSLFSSRYRPLLLLGLIAIAFLFLYTNLIGKSLSYQLNPLF